MVSSHHQDHPEIIHRIVTAFGNWLRQRTNEFNCISLLYKLKHIQIADTIIYRYILDYNQATRLFIYSVEISETVQCLIVHTCFIFRNYL